MDKGLVIFNPKAGQQNEGLPDLLRTSLPEADHVTTDQLDDSNRDFTGRPWIAVAGGDGTVEAIAARLVGCGIPLGIIPAGTYNNLARSLDLPLDPVEACAVVTAGRTRPIDVGVANGKPFFECLGSGLDAALYPFGEQIKSGKLTRWIHLLRRAYRYPRQRFVVSLDRPVCDALVRGTTNESRHLVHLLRRRGGNEITLSALMLTVSNGPYFGMNFHVAPGQRMDDGFLTVTVFSRYSKLQLWWHFLSLAFGKHEYCPKAIAFRVRSLRISGPRPLPVHLDGTPEHGLWPLAISCQAGSIPVFRR